MTEEKKEFLKCLRLYWIDNPDVRIGQSLQNLDVNQFAIGAVKNETFLLRDIYGDSDKQIVKRMDDRRRKFRLEKLTRENDEI